MKKSLCVFFLIFVVLSAVAPVSNSADYDIIQLTDNNDPDWDPKINNRGEVVWASQDSEDESLSVFLYDGSDTIEIVRHEDYAQ